MLHVTQLSKSLGSQRIVQALSFDVHAGEIVALIGPNGAGKSTTFNLLTGQLSPDAGDIRLNNQSLLGLSAHQICRLGVGRTFQIAQIFESFTVIENVQIALLTRDRQTFHWWSSRRQQRHDEAMHWLDQVGLSVVAQQSAATLSYGDVKRLELAMALVARPPLLLMDEPTAGMAPLERLALMSLVREQVQQHNMAILFTEHSMDMVFEFAQRILVMAHGQLIAQGDAAHIRQHEQVQSLYLGRGLNTPREGQR